MPPGSEQLDQLLRRHPEIVWVTKFGNFAARDRHCRFLADAPSFPTVAGDPTGRIVTAARLESFDRDARDAGNDMCRILIGETTLRCLKGQFRIEDVGRCKFKGKQREIAVYRVLGPADDERTPTA